MLVEGVDLLNVLKAKHEPPKTARVAEVRKVEAAVASGEESAHEAAVAQIAEDPKVMTQGEFEL